MSYTITNITQATQAVVTINATGTNPLSAGNLVAFAAVVGMTQINGTNGTVLATGGSSGAFTATVNINSTAYTAYSSGGTLTILTGVPISNLPTGSALSGLEPTPCDQGTTTIKTPGAAWAAQVTSTAEVACGLTPTFATYRVSPKVDPRRYGAKGDGSTDDTTAMNDAINVAYASRGTVILPENFKSVCGPLTLVMSGTDSTNTSFAIEGQGQTSSQILQKSGATTALLTLSSTNGNTTLQTAQVVLENFGIIGSNTSAGAGTGIGIYMTGLAWWRVSNVQARFFNLGFEALNSLLGLVDQQCQFVNNIAGIYIAREGTYLSSNIQVNNVITIRDCRINQNSTLGVSYAGGSLLCMESNDIESNGTSGNVATGGVYTANDLAGTFGLAKLEFRSNWFEANYGVGLNIAGLSSGSLFVNIDGGQIISNEAGRALNIAQTGNAASQVDIRQMYSPSAGDTWNIKSGDSNISGCLVANLNDTSTRRNYLGYATSSGAGPGFGVAGSFTGTLTGVSPGVTCTIEYVIMGKIVNLYIPPVTGASNSTACSITGWPTALQPANPQSFIGNIADGSGSGQFSLNCYLNGGTMSLSGPLAGGTFTGSGTKGLYGLSGSYLLY